MKDLTTPAQPMAVPLYKEVAIALAEFIHTGDWKAGDAIPPEPVLASKYGVSMGTLRKAVDELVAKGMLIRQQGRGTFVSRHNKDRYLFAFFHITRLDGEKRYPQVKLVEYARVKATAEAARLLGVARGDSLVRLTNILALGGKTVIVDEIFLPDATFPGLSKNVVTERPGTLYQLYQDHFGVTVTRTEEHLRAVKAKPFAANLLGVAIADPLLEIIRVARTFRNQAVELRYSWVNTEDYEYYAELSGNPQR